MKGQRKQGNLAVTEREQINSISSVSFSRNKVNFGKLCILKEEQLSREYGRHEC